MTSVLPRGFAVVAHCGCGKTYTQCAWNGLRKVGVQVVAADLETGEDSFTIELRNCSCNSTIAVELTDARG